MALVTPTYINMRGSYKHLAERRPVKQSVPSDLQNGVDEVHVTPLKTHVHYIKK